MGQPDNTAEEGIDTNTGSPTSEDQHPASIYAYRDQIEQISKSINSMPQWELARDYEKMKNLETQIADVIDNLEALSGNPLEKNFDKTSVLKNLNTSRVELNKAARLAAATDEQIQMLCFDRIVDCRGYLNLAKGLMPKKGG